MINTVRLFVATAIASAVAAQVGVAQSACTAGPASSCYVGLDLQMSTSPALELSVTQSTVAFPVADVMYLSAGSTTAAAPSVLSISANATWQLQISAASSVWMGTGSIARSTKPASDLQWCVTSNGTFAGLTTVPATVAQGSPGTTLQTSIYFRALTDWQHDPPGQYTLTITYTLVAP